MTYIFIAAGAVVALIMAYFLLGHMVADWLDRECEKMLNDAMAEECHSVRFFCRGMRNEADWHYGNAEILRRNVRACRRVAGWLR